MKRLSTQRCCDEKLKLLCEKKVDNCSSLCWFTYYMNFFMSDAPGSKCRDEYEVKRLTEPLEKSNYHRHTRVGRVHRRSSWKMSSCVS